jgi:hypothetical protein
LGYIYVTLPIPPNGGGKGPRFFGRKIQKNDRQYPRSPLQVEDKNYPINKVFPLSHFLGVLYRAVSSLVLLGGIKRCVA